MLYITGFAHGHTAVSTSKTQHGVYSTRLSSIAALHEDCERLERVIVKDFNQDVKGHREKLAQGHRVRKMLDQLQSQSQRLVCSFGFAPQYLLNGPS